MKNVKLNVEGMHCEGCSKRLENVLNELEGVESANVSLEEKTAEVNYNEEEIKLEEIKEAIIDAGFEVI